MRIPRLPEPPALAETAAEVPKGARVELTGQASTMESAFSGLFYGLVGAIVLSLAFAGIGATVYARLGGDHGSVWAVLLAALICMPVGALLALPAMRLHGLYLALATMAFASMVDFIFYSQPFAVGTRSLPVEHLRLFGLRFEGLRGFLLLVTAVKMLSQRFWNFRIE